MLTNARKINSDSTISEIVSKHYRTADIFRQHGIDFCCGGKIPLKTVCELRQLNLESIEEELEKSIRPLCISNTLKFNEWNIDFLTDYLVNIHHEYLKNSLPAAVEFLDRFVEGHQKKYPYLQELQSVFHEMAADIIPHLAQEEEIIFPYIKQIAHAYESKEIYASLFVRTLRKPIENMISHEHEIMGKILHRIRKMTDNYNPPEDACVNHKVTFQKLQEIDNDLVQHIHLENDILFPKAVAMEKELLHRD